MGVVDRDGGRLACGAEVGVLVDQVADALPATDPPHQASCAHCQAALRELELLWSDVRELASQDVVAPRSLVERVISRVRGELAPSVSELPLEAVVPRLVRHALFRADRGTTRIADAVIARLAAKVVEQVPGAQLLGGPRGTNVDVGEGAVSIALRLAVVYGASVPELTRTVRSGVIRAVEAMTGLTVDSVDVAVEEIVGDL
jgi:uncharacterized alkaline shock family protein YloU